MEFEPVIGLEVHVELNTASKIFCGCSTRFGGAPNSNVCPVCLGLPGVLPVLNREVLEKAVLAGIALNGEISRFSRFDRKQYFYPDLPKGYQISQLNFPIMKNGHVSIPLENGEKTVRINRIHMEEDAGKLVHSEDPSLKNSFVDINRAGVPLIEIVSEPDLSSPSEASSYLMEIRKIMKYIGVSDVNMEEGSLRCDANVSVMPKGSKTLGTRAEIKNMNSFRFVERAIAFEIKRQIKVIEEGGKVIQETRLYDSQTDKTASMRSKEEANDYRYFPEPDLVPLELSEEFIQKIRSKLPELHYQMKKRFMETYGLPEYDADLLTSERDIALYFEAVCKSHPRPKAVSNWIMSEVLKYLNENGLEIKALKVKPEDLAAMLKFMEDGTISGKIAKELFWEMTTSGKSPSSLIQEKGLTQVSDTAALEKIIDEVLAENPDAVEKFRSGKTTITGHLMGQVMKKTKGKANPQVCTELLLKKLGQA